MLLDIASSGTTTDLSPLVLHPDDWLFALTTSFRLACAFILGWSVASVYRGIRPSRMVAATFPSTLVLLTMLISLVTLVIGDNLARAFGLVGALSIVRFRTVVEDTFDIAFVIFAVVIGMAAGGSPLVIALCGTVIVSIAAWVVRPIPELQNVANWDQADATLTVRVGVGGIAETLPGHLNEYLERTDLQHVETSRGGSSLILTYKVRLKPSRSVTEFVQSLQRVPGVQDVELTRQSKDSN